LKYSPFLYPFLLMKKLSNFLVGGGLFRANGDPAQVGDSVRLFLDTRTFPAYPESIVATIGNPIAVVNCGEDVVYVLEYTETFTLRTADILNGVVLADNDISDVSGIRIWNSDQQIFQRIVVRGLAGSEILEIL
jgi:hypothetical protein